MARWFGWPGILLTSLVPLLVALLAWRFWRGLARDEHFSPFACALAITSPGRPVQSWLWFIGLYAAGVVSVVSVAAALRWVLLRRL